MNNKEIEQSAIDRYGKPRKIEEISEEELRQAVKECKTFAGVRLRLGLGSTGCTNDQVFDFCRNNDIDCSSLIRGTAGAYEIFSLSELEDIAKRSATIQEFCSMIPQLSASHARTLLGSYIEKSKILQSFFDSHQRPHSGSAASKISRYSISEIEKIVEESQTYNEIASKIGYSKDFGIRRCIKALGISTSHIDDRIEQQMLSQLRANNELSGNTVMRALRYIRDVSCCDRCQNSTHNSLPLIMTVHHINGCHDDNRVENIAILCPTCHSIVHNKSLTLESFSSIKNSIVERDGLRCNCCGIDEIDGFPIPLELHHKNGNHQDDHPDNLELLCPNCHAQTETWCNKNSNTKHLSDDDLLKALQVSSSRCSAAKMLGVRPTKAFYERSNQLIDTHNITFCKTPPSKISDETINEIILLLQQRNMSYDEIADFCEVSSGTVGKINHGQHNKCPKNLAYPIREPLHHRSGTSTKRKKKVLKSEKRCPSCGTPITKNSKLCSKCSHEGMRKVKRPTREELFELIRNFPINKIAEKFSVSDTTIRKWLKQYELPYNFHDIKQFFRQNPTAESIFIETDSDLESEILATYGAMKSLIKTAKILHCSTETVKRVCEKYQIPVLSVEQKHGFPVIATNKINHKKILFLSQFEARDFLLSEDSTRSNAGILAHIRDAVNQKHERNSAYGYIWNKLTLDDLCNQDLIIYMP